MRENIVDKLDQNNKNIIAIQIFKDQTSSCCFKIKKYFKENLPIIL